MILVSATESDPAYLLMAGEFLLDPGARLADVAAPLADFFGELDVFRCLRNSARRGLPDRLAVHVECVVRRRPMQRVSMEAIRDGRFGNLLADAFVGAPVTIPVQIDLVGAVAFGEGAEIRAEDGDDRAVLALENARTLNPQDKTMWRMLGFAYARAQRDSLAALRVLPINAANGVRLTLADVADISLVPGPPMLRSENGQLATYIHVNTTRSDVSALVAKLQQSIADGVDLPVGYTLDWSGQFEYLQHAMERLRVLVPATLVLIFLLIYLIFRNVGDVLVIMLSLPLALIGGLWLIWLMGHAVSVASVIGFIALAGVAAEFGVIMMLTLRQAWQHELKQNPRAGNAELDRAIREGALMRVRPKAMTVAVIMAGLLPILVGSGAGSEVMQRIAAPMVGGMLTAPLLSMLVIPVAFRLLRQREIAGKRA